MTSYLYDVWRERIDEWLERESLILSGMSKQKTQLVTSPSAATTATGIGPVARLFNSGETPWSPRLVSGFSEDIGRIAMNNYKGVQFKLGGTFRFVVTKTFIGDNERFSVRIGEGDSYGASSIELADNLTWAEASSAMNAFKDEFEDAFDTLVQVSTLTATGAHEES